MEKMDFKKTFKQLYQPKTEPVIIEVPQMKFLQISGKGNPNEIEGEYQKAVEILYALSYAIKMMPKSGYEILNYYEYVVPPLEGLWWLEDSMDNDFTQKSKYQWISMIRQPEFVTNEIVMEVIQKVSSKKPLLPVEKVEFTTFTEGLCVHCMHKGSFDQEVVTLEKMNLFMKDNNLINDLSSTRRHHEIYLSDPRKTEVDKRRTILRHPVKTVMVDEVSVL